MSKAYSVSKTLQPNARAQYDHSSLSLRRSKRARQSTRESKVIDDVAVDYGEFETPTSLIKWRKLLSSFSDCGLQYYLEYGTSLVRILYQKSDLLYRRCTTYLLSALRSSKSKEFRACVKRCCFKFIAKSYYSWKLD
jgi:hypothetical protein